jgi:hypothetical protein
MDTVTKTEARAVPWNKGRLLGQKPPLKLKEIWAIRIRLQLLHRSRELVLFNLAVMQKKTHQPVQCNGVAGFRPYALANFSGGGDPGPLGAVAAAALIISLEPAIFGGHNP